MQFLWNVSIIIRAKVKHNAPDLLIWCRGTNTCKIVELSCSADVKVTKKIQEKEENFGPLIHMLQVMYPEYIFLFIPIILDAM